MTVGKSGTESAKNVTLVYNSLNFGHRVSFPVSVRPWIRHSPSALSWRHRTASPASVASWHRRRPPPHGGARRLPEPAGRGAARADRHLARLPKPRRNGEDLRKAGQVGPDEPALPEATSRQDLCVIGRVHHGTAAPEPARGAEPGDDGAHDGRGRADRRRHDPEVTGETGARPPRQPGDPRLPGQRPPPSREGAEPFPERRECRVRPRFPPPYAPHPTRSSVRGASCTVT